MKINLDLEKIHNVNLEEGYKDVEVSFETKKFKGVTFSMNITRDLVSKSYGYNIQEDFLGKYSKRQINVFSKWIDKYQSRLLEYFLNECSDTIIIIKVLLG